MKKFTLLLGVLFIVFIGAFADNIWIEDFDNDDGIGLVGVSVDSVTISSPSDSTWTVDTVGATLSDANDWFKVVNGKMEARDTDGEVIWRSAVIDISAYDDISISVDISTEVGLEATDYIEAYYSIDGNSELVMASLSGDFQDSTVSNTALEGSSLVIILKVMNNAATEYIRFDNVMVEGTPTLPKPTISNVFPLSESMFELGEVFEVSAMVTTTDGLIDSAFIFYGPAEDALNNSVKCDVLVDTFFTDMNFDLLDTVYIQFMVYASNETTNSSGIIKVIAVCPVVEVPVASMLNTPDENSFTAEWSSSSSALGYLLDVWQEQYVPEIIYVSSDFDDGVSPLDSGWSDIQSVSTTTLGINGKALKLGTAATPGILSSPTFIADQNFSVIFYAKEFNSDEQSITVEYGEQSFNIQSLDSVWTRYELDFTFQVGADSVTFSAQRAFLDSVLVKTSNLQQNLILESDSIKVGTSKLIEGLSSNSTYKYSVRAYNAYGCESMMSNVVDVTTAVATTTSSVSNLVISVYGINDGILVRLDGEYLVTVYDIAGRKVAKKTIYNEANIAVKAGIYLVKIGDNVTKVIVK